MLIQLIYLLLVINQFNSCIYKGDNYGCGAKNEQGQYCNWMIVGNWCGSSGAGKCCDYVWCDKFVDCQCQTWSSACSTDKVVNDSYVR